MTKSAIRTKSTGEVFTPPRLVDEIVDHLYQQSPDLFTDPSKTFLDPAVGDGEFLRGIIRKLASIRPTFTKDDWTHTITNQLHGIDIMWDNVCDTVYYLQRSLPTKSTTKQIAYSIVMQYRMKEKEPRSQVIQRIMEATGCSRKAAIPLYSVSKTTYAEKWKAAQNGATPLQIITTFKDGFVIADHHTPDEINENFLQRTYTDDRGTLQVRRVKGSNHYVEYSTNGKKWTKVENIVRANALTEWDCKEWQPIKTESDLLIFDPI